MRMGWSDTGSVPARVGTHVADKITIGLSLYLVPSEMLNLQCILLVWCSCELNKTSDVVRIRVAWFHQGLRRGAP